MIYFTTHDLREAFIEMDGLASDGVLCGIFHHGQGYIVMPDEDADRDPSLIRVTPRMELEVVEEERDEAWEEASYRDELRYEREYS